VRGLQEPSRGLSLAHPCQLARFTGRFAAALPFLLRIRFGLHAVLSQLGAECDWAVMEQGKMVDL